MFERLLEPGCTESPACQCGGEMNIAAIETLPQGSEGEQREALKAYAFSVWQLPAFDHVTEVAWRLAVEFADSNGCSGGRDFLKRFNANRERYSCEATRRKQ